MAETTETLLKLFVEIAMVEHLARTRVDQGFEDGLTAGHFGLINHFVRTPDVSASIAALAWAFQEDETYTLAKAETLAERGYVALTRGITERDTLVTVTPEGRDAHEAALERLRPEFAQLVVEIAPEDIATTYRVLHDMRLTLDNLPDR